MNPKFRPLYLIAGALGLVLLLYCAVSTAEDMDLVAVLSIAIPDMFFFYLAYKTYPADMATENIDRY
jgi:hypothetical protein